METDRNSNQHGLVSLDRHARTADGLENVAGHGASPFDRVLVGGTSGQVRRLDDLPHEAT